MPKTAAKIDAVADLLGVTTRRVQQLADEGVLPREGRGEYDAVACARAYIRYLQDKVAKRQGEVDGDAKAERERWQAARERLKYEREVAAVVDAADMREAIGRAFANVKARLLAIPAAHAHELSGITDPHRVQSILAGSIKHALTELASGVVEHEPERDPQPSGDGTAPAARPDSVAVGRKRKGTVARGKRRAGSVAK